MNTTIPSNATQSNAAQSNATKSKPRRTYVPQTDFLMAHDMSDSLQEVADRLGMKVSSVSTRASKYRKDGINLKKFPSGGRGRRTDVVSANQFLAELRANRAEAETTIEPASQEVTVE